MLQDRKNSGSQSNVGVGSAISFCTSKGWNVAIPLSDVQEYDLIFDIDGKLAKDQVKTTFHKTKCGFYRAALKTCGGNKSGNIIKKFDSTKVDYLFILTNCGDKYFIPCDNFIPKTAITLGKQYKKYLVL